MSDRWISVDRLACVPEDVRLADALAAIRAHYRVAEDALQSAVADGKYLYVTKDFVHHHSCSSLRPSFSPERWCTVNEASSADEISSEYLYVEKEDRRGPQQLREIARLVSPHDTEAMRGRRRCHICAPEIPDPPPRHPRLPRGCKVVGLDWRDIGREYEGSPITKIEITTRVRLTCADGRTFDFELDESVILGSPVNPVKARQ